MIAVWILFLIGIVIIYFRKGPEIAKKALNKFAEKFCMMIVSSGGIYVIKQLIYEYYQR